MQETWKIVYSMVYCTSQAKKRTRSGEATRAGDSPSVASTSESTDGTGSAVRQNITLHLKVALWNFEIPSRSQGLDISMQEATQSMPKSTL